MQKEKKDISASGFFFSADNERSFYADKFRKRNNHHLQ